MQLDVKALYANDEIKPEIFEAAALYFIHVHTNEPNLGVLGSSRRIDHGGNGRSLGEVDYDRYVSIEQKMEGEDGPLAAIERNVRFLREYYR